MLSELVKPISLGAPCGLTTFGWHASDVEPGVESTVQFAVESLGEAEAPAAITVGPAIAATAIATADNVR
ncbi:MAG TPA: hypothetical protein VH496_12845 [Mycobacterium sp.]